MAINDIPDPPLPAMDDREAIKLIEESAGQSSPGGTALKPVVLHVLRSELDAGRRYAAMFAEELAR